jgi:hypothetical protein
VFRAAVGGDQNREHVGKGSDEVEITDGSGLVVVDHRPSDASEASVLGS